MDRELHDLIDRLRTFHDWQWDRYIISQDRHARFFTREDMSRISIKAHILGEEAAKKLQDQYTDLKGALAAASVKIRMAEDHEFLVPGRICLGQYYDEEILISRSFSDRVQENYEGLRQMLGDFSIINTITAHELYHHLEDLDDSLMTRQEKLSVKVVPWLTKRIVPDAAGEISAFSFARTMTGLDFHPCILELAGMWPEHKGYVCRLADTIGTYDNRSCA